MRKNYILCLVGILIFILLVILLPSDKNIENFKYYRYIDTGWNTVKIILYCCGIALFIIFCINRDRSAVNYISPPI